MPNPRTSRGAACKLQQGYDVPRKEACHGCVSTGKPRAPSYLSPQGPWPRLLRSRWSSHLSGQAWLAGELGIRPNPFDPAAVRKYWAIAVAGVTSSAVATLVGVPLKEFIQVRGHALGQGRRVVAAL